MEVVVSSGLENSSKFQLRLLVQKTTLLLDCYRMLRNPYLYENRMFPNKVNTALFEVGKEERVALIKRIK